MRAAANGIEIEYDTFGNPSDEPIVLIMGLGSQMILWHEDFCTGLAERGHFVVRFDNRDIGLSTKFDEHGIPNVLELLMKVQQGEPLEVPYTLDDMADDTVGLMDALGLERAHVCGASMGGMIAQTVAIRHPRRVKTLTSIMSSTGDPTLPGPRGDVMGVLMTPIPSDRAGYVDRMVNIFRTIAGRGFPFDADVIRDRAERSFERSPSPGGQPRQLAAILAHGDRTERLRRLRVPTLVIHGDDDPLVPVECGRATAEAIPGAELLIVPGLGHSLVPGLWPLAIDAISQHVRRAA